MAGFSKYNPSLQGYIDIKPGGVRKPPWVKGCLLKGAEGDPCPHGKMKHICAECTPCLHVKLKRKRANR